MNYREKIEEHLGGEGQRQEWAKALLDTLSDAYDAGGETAVSAALSEKMKAFETEFQTRLAALENTL